MPSAGASVLMLENLRFHAEEENERRRRSPGPWPRLAQVYVDDAFAAAHRAHASIEAITRYLRPAVAGLLMATRAHGARPHLRQAGALRSGPSSEAPRSPTSWPSWRTSLTKVEGLLVGGGMAFTFLASLGHDVGRSLVEPDRLGAARTVLERARSAGIPLRLPVDVVVAAGPRRDDRASHRGRSARFPPT